MKKYQDQELIENLRKIAKQLRRTPKMREFDKISCIHSSIYEKRFKGWNKAVKKSGLRTRSARKKYTEQEILDEVKRLYGLNKLATTEQEFLKGAKISLWTINNRFGSLNNVLQKLNFPIIKRQYNKKKYTDQEILDEIKRLYIININIKSIEDFLKGAKISFWVIKKRFGSLNNALQKLNLSMTKIHYEKYTDEEILNEVERLYKINAGFKSQQDFLKEAKISLWTIKNRFGSLEEAFKKVGFLTIDECIIGNHKKDLNDEYLRLIKILKHTPTTNDIKKHSKFCTGYFRNYFDSFSSLAKLHNVNPNRGGPTDKISDENLMKELKRFAKELGRTPKKEEMNIKNTKYSINAYKRAFGTWGNAIKKAGLMLNIKRYTKQDIINDVKRVAEELGRTPMKKEFVEKTILKTSSFTCMFESWNDVIQKAGLKIVKHGKLTDEEVRQRVVAVVEKIGCVPTYDAFWTNSDISANTVCQHFGPTWEEAMHNLGYTDYKTQRSFIGKNPQIGKDGTKYDSMLEKLIADYMFELQQQGYDIIYEFGRRICKERKWTCDFVILYKDKELYLEADGLRKDRPIPYNSGNNEKIEYYKKNNYNYYILNYEHSVEKFFKTFISTHNENCI